MHQLHGGEDIAGWIMLFDGMLVDQQARLAFEQSLHATIQLALSADAAAELQQLFQLLLVATQQPKPSKYHTQFVQALLNGFFYKTADHLQAQEATSLGNFPSRAVDITQQFTRLIKEHFRTA